jgi:hypothetical protein
MFSISSVLNLFGNGKVDPLFVLSVEVWIASDLDFKTLRGIMRGQIISRQYVETNQSITTCASGNKPLRR